MADVHDDTLGAEHPGFLQKIKDTLHIGQHHKDEHVTTPAPTASPVSTGAAEMPSAPIAMPKEEATGHHPTTDLNSLAGHESEHHGGVPTFLVALPDQDIPEEVTKETATSDVTGESGGQGGGEFFDSEEVFSKAQEGEHHEGVPTFLVALPGEDMPDKVTKEKLHHVEEQQQHDNSPKDLDSEELFSNAQQGEHHGGVPTFLVALPDQEIPQEVNKEVAGGKAHDSGVNEEGFDSEEVFSKAQKGEHHEGVPTFLVALPDQDLPDEGTKEKLHHVSAAQQD